MNTLESIQAQLTEAVRIAKEAELALHEVKLARNNDEHHWFTVQAEKVAAARITFADIQSDLAELSEVDALEAQVA